MSGRRGIRWRRVAAALLAMAVLAGVGGWAALSYGWPRYRPTLHSGEAFTVDVSSHQGAIDWRAVAGDGVRAAYIKSSEGGDWEDPRFVANWRGASEAGLRVGAYHFFTLCRDGREQADNLLRMLERAGPTGQPMLAPAIDLELGGNCADRPDAAVVEGRVADFVARVEERTGRRVLVYALGGFTERYPRAVPGDRPLWVRRLGLRPDGDWAWWQVNNRAVVEGVVGPVDLNVARGLA